MYSFCTATSLNRSLIMSKHFTHCDF